MDELPSAQFRKVYGKLTKPTMVTVNGHAIGVWTPGAPWSVTVAGIGKALDAIDGTPLSPRAFNSKPFTPVPKSRPSR